MSDAGGFITIRNWEKFQQYKDRRPTWIKAYVELLDHYDYARLPDAQKAHIFGLWLLAALTGNKIPADPAWIAKKINATEPLDLLRLKSLGFIQYESLQASVRDDETKRSLEKRRKETREEMVAAPPAPPTSAAVVPLKAPAGPCWTRDACDDWIAAYRGTAPGGRIGKGLKPLVDREGWTNVRPAWRSYLAQTEAEYASPQRFAATFGRWSGSAPAAAPRGKPSVADQTRSEMEAFMRGED